MKKNVILIVFLILSVLVFFKVKNIFIKQYEISYKVSSYKVNENYMYKKKHSYDIAISNKENTYLFSIDSNFNKSKKIIKNIKSFKSGNINCILPLYKKDISKILYCNMDSDNVSTSYLINTKNKHFRKILEKVSKYDILLPDESNVNVKYKNLDIYKNNILDNQIYFIWNYKGVISINKDNRYKKVFDTDLYDNVMATTVGSYYVIFDNTSVNGIEDIYYYDYNKNRLNVMKLKVEERLSKDSYINGVYEDKIYVTDKKYKKEYAISLNNKKIKEIDDEQTKYITYVGGQRLELSKSDFFMREQIFDGYVKIEDRDVYDLGNVYYYLDNDKIYKVYKTNQKKNILLLELEKIKEWKVVNDGLLILQDDLLYYYNDVVGLRIILKSNELKYNYRNIYQLGRIS